MDHSGASRPSVSSDRGTKGGLAIEDLACVMKESAHS